MDNIEHYTKSFSPLNKPIYVETPRIHSSMDRHTSLNVDISWKMQGGSFNVYPDLVAHSYNLSYIECKSGPRQKA
jgi:hypothetical protein